MSRTVVAAYVSGHGYGHFTRSSAVLEEVARAATVHLRTSGTALALAAPFAASVGEVDVGPGVAQRGPLAVDVPATRAALARHLGNFSRLVDEEAAWLGAVGARLVFADVPPLAFAAAARAGIPSVGLANFSWSWIYEGYAGHDPWFKDAAARLAEAESSATLLLALDGGGGLAHFPRRADVPPVARRPTRSRASARELLPGPDNGRPIALVSFGGFGGALDLAELGSRNPDYRVLIVGVSVAPSAALPHQDLVSAVDCVVGKPGYSTVAECLATPTPLVYVPRGEFREYDALVAAIERWLPCAPLPVEELLAGRWSEAIARALASRPPSPPGGDGVTAAVERVRALL